MGMENFSLSDVAAVTGNNDGFGGGGGGFGLIWLFAILALFGGGGFGGNRGNAATTEDLASGFNFSGLNNKTDSILAAVNNNNQVFGNAICQLGYQNSQNFAALERQIADCCCATQLSIKDVKFDMANYNAATNATVVAQTQRILDAMAADKAAAQEARIQQLELEKALCGVVKYPLQMTYTAYCNPFCPPEAVR